MNPERRWVPRDLAAGLIAILAVVGVSVRAAFVGSDMRVLFAVTSAAFFSAGVLRGGDPRRSAWLRGLVTSSPGLLGTAALIVNDGLHRLAIPIAISFLSILVAVAGVQTRRWWSRTRRRSLALCAGILVLVGLEWVAMRPFVAYASLHRVDRPAPAVALTTFTGDTIRIAGFHGRVVVLAFWATWCLPCRWELPELESACARLARDSTIVFAAVDVGSTFESETRTRRFLARHPLRMQTAYDPGPVSAAFGVHALPTVLLIDPSGRVRFEHHGYDRSEHVADVLMAGIRRLQRRRTAGPPAGS